MSRGSQLQLDALGVLAERIGHHRHRLLVGIVAKGVCAKPNLIDIDIKVVGRAFGEAENEIGIGSAAVPKLHIILHLHQALQQGRVVAHVHIILALHTKGGDVAEKLHPLASIVTHLHTTDAVVSVTVAVHAIILKMCHDFFEGTHMRREDVITFGAVYRWCTNEVTVHSHHIQMAVHIVGHYKMVCESGCLVTRLRHADGHVEVAKARGSPKTVVIAVFGVIRVLGLEADFLTINARFDLGELDDFGVFDIS